MNSIIAPILARVSKWAGVETDRTPKAVSFRLDGREFAHVSKSGTLTVPTTPTLRNQLLTDGFADTVPQRRDWVSYRVRSTADVSGAIRLLRVAYLSAQRETETQPTSLERFSDHLRRLDASAELLALLSGPAAGPMVEPSDERQVA